MKIIAHLSDLHFGRTDPDIVAGLLRDLALHLPDVVAISGDLVQRARCRHFRAAQHFLQQLPAPYLVVPGNHDIPVYNVLSRFTTPFGYYQRYITRDLSPLHTDVEMVILGVNTARPFISNFTRGRINRAQLARIEEVFAELPPTTFKVVVAHHPFLPPPDRPDTPLVGRVGLALPVLEACGIDLLLAGHLHRTYSGALSDHHILAERKILVAHAATATSTRRRNEPNAYNRITIAPPLVSLEVRCWDGQTFVAAATYNFVRTRQGWDSFTAPVLVQERCS